MAYSTPVVGFGQVGGKQCTLFVEAGTLTRLGRGADLGGAVRERGRVQPVGLGHVRHESLRSVAALVELVGEAEVVPAGAVGALAAPFGGSSVGAGDGFDADGVGEPLPSGAPPARAGLGSKP